MAKPRGKSDIFGGTKKTDYNYMAYLEDEIRKKEELKKKKKEQEEVFKFLNVYYLKIYS